ncbi:E3 ubiquitin protein ligase RIN2 [Camellia lanceoleosa]|uniref:E3 ubiquitin protein ligase RIN2 n=1 Tax=Camellia lanceoleosa TaxID=1840588 RepID=A0ACC0GZ57_9ERIC|nr:E3 ubiquitin protein ligase RIN2 [Camellia lanceoleosa]
MFLLLFFEPLSIAFETLQAIVIHGFQLLDIWLHDSAGNNINCQRSKLLDISAAGSFCEWKGILIMNLGFLLDIMTLLMALCHYVHIWWLHGMKFHLVDAVLFLNIMRKVEDSFRCPSWALPDATPEEIEAYDDECAICREPMAKAKRLSCKHLFHLACLRSWTDSSWLQTWSRQGLHGAGPTTGTRSAGLGRVQMITRHLAAVGESSAQNTLEVTPWSLWSMNPSQAGTSNSTLPAAGSVGYPGSAGGLHMRSTSRVANDNIANDLLWLKPYGRCFPTSQMN